jgi:SH3 domain protein
MKPPVKRYVFVAMCLLFSHAVVSAETLYVTDNVKLTLRSGPSNEYKIIAIIESGQQVEMLKPGDEWSYIKFGDDKEGYVLTRYLTPDPTHNVKLNQLETRHKELTQQADALLEENTQLKKENQSLQSVAETNAKELKKLSEDYEKLKAESADFLTLKSKYETAAAELAQQTKRADKLEDEMGSLAMSQYIKWFLAGSGVLVAGFFIGYSARRQRRRSSLL